MTRTVRQVSNRKHKRKENDCLCGRFTKSLTSLLGEENNHLNFYIGASGNSRQVVITFSVVTKLETPKGTNNS